MIYKSHSGQVRISTKNASLLLIATIFLSIFFYSIVAFYTSSRVIAADARNFNAGNIISDTEFRNNNSMSADDIQKFLNNKNSTCLRNYQGLALIDANGNGQVEDWTSAERYGGTSGNQQMSAAQLIKAASDIYKINPRVLLVTLQKEQGLITRADCPSWRYNTAFGFGCPDTAPCDQAAYGFTNQLDNAAYHFKGYFLDSLSYVPYTVGNYAIYWSPNLSCGLTNTYIENRATAALYSYTPYRPNQAALNAGYGEGDSCSAHGNRNFWLYYNDWFGSTQQEVTYVNFKSHLSYYGWTNSSVNSGITGTVGQSRPVEAFKINGEVEYSSYNSTSGWQNTVKDGMISGTTGMSKNIQAIKVTPTGSFASKYDIYYRVHASYIGWMGWAKNGEQSGVIGSNTNNIEAIEIYLAPKGSSAPGSQVDATRTLGPLQTQPNRTSLSVSSHVAFVGWQPIVTDSMVTGTTEINKGIEATKISIGNTGGYSGSVLYSAHVASKGWQDWVSNGQIAGTVGEKKSIEAIRIALTGDLGNQYDIYYRGYVQYKGWLDWTHNGAPAGSVGASSQIEAIETRLVKKGDPVPGSTVNPLYNPQRLELPETYQLSYSAHVSFVGWQTGKSQGSVAGSTGISRSLEALRFDQLSSMYGNLQIKCSALSKDSTWKIDIPKNEVCGTVGSTKPLLALNLSLDGDAAAKYKLRYRVHLAWTGWQGWVDAGQVAGINNQSSTTPIEAIQLELTAK